MHVKARLAKVEGEGKTIDWATAEAMAWGSLQMQVRFFKYSHMEKECTW